MACKLIALNGYMQAIGDGGQDWANALLFVIFSKNIRQRLFGNPLKKMWGCVQKTNSHSVHTSPNIHSELSQTAPESDRISYPSNTYCIISHTNHSDFTSAHNGPDHSDSEM